MPPPSSDISIAQKASSGIMTTAEIRRGMTSASIGDTPIVRIASISSVIFIVPSCAAKAEPERPATMIAVIKRAQLANRDPADQVDRVDFRAELLRAGPRPAGR